jgi:DNA polymerase-3 subunit gamma/tau
MEKDALDSKAHSQADSGYTVVARRYRPKSFAELIGQDHISQALMRAISAGRVGHAYLFTGARGVGKTSTARIFAKALNASDDLDAALATDVARCIDAGDDMDVIEIDGASNRGIEEIRQLRANVNVRPSRSRFKIYIIDEVHMLTNQAFNALLKTLEEPPPHVKFIFCTTDPDKIPITVLSRCQRFDFAPVRFEAIQSRLQEICVSEGFEADDNALALLARRAAGSMRDSQSLLEQVMSFSSDRITVEQVHALLGTADEGRLSALVRATIDGDALQAIQLVDTATRAGAEAGQLAEQLLNYLRDLMAVGLGGGSDVLKLANPAGYDELSKLASEWGTQSILAAIQIIDESLVRMRTSVSSVTLLEVALVQICQLESLASIPELLERVSQATGNVSTTTRPAEKKKPERLASAAIDQGAETVREPPGTGPNIERNPSEHGLAQPRPRATPSPSNQSPQHSVREHSGPEHAMEAGVDAVHSVSAPQHQQPQHQQPQHQQPQHQQPQHRHQQPEAAVEEPAAFPEQAVVGKHADVTDVSTMSSVGTPIEYESVGAETSADLGESVAPDKDAAPDKGHVVFGQQEPASPEALTQWKSSVGKIDDMLADFALMAREIEPLGADRWKVIFPPGATRPVEYCQQPERKATLERAIETQLGRHVSLEFAAAPGQAPSLAAAKPQASVLAQKLREMTDHPYVKKLCEVIDGEIIRVDMPRKLTSPHNSVDPKSSADRKGSESVSAGPV